MWPCYFRWMNVVSVRSVIDEAGEIELDGDGSTSCGPGTINPFAAITSQVKVEGAYVSLSTT